MQRGRFASIPCVYLSAMVKEQPCHRLMALLARQMQWGGLLLATPNVHPGTTLQQHLNYRVVAKTAGNMQCCRGIALDSSIYLRAML